MASNIIDLGTQDFYFWDPLKIRFWTYLNHNNQSLFQKLPLTIVRECRNMPAVLIQNVFEGMVNR